MFFSKQLCVYFLLCEETPMLILAVPVYRLQGLDQTLRRTAGESIISTGFFVGHRISYENGGERKVVS